MSDGAVFKRRKRPAGAKATSSSATPEPAPAAAASSSAAAKDETAVDGEQDDSPTATIEEMLALRKLKRAHGGIELERLNAGDRKRRKAGGAAGGDEDEEQRQQQQQQQREKEGERKLGLVKADNFTGQTNTVDVDKHMMEYIEAELKKRRGSSSVDESAEELTRRAKDPHDELYAIAERFKVTNATRRAAGDDGDEGNVTLSAGMLTAIPEVDLGVDVRLRNIEETEKAKQAVISSAKSSEPERGDPGFERFWRQRQGGHEASDAQALARARLEAAGHASATPSPPPQQQQQQQREQGARRQYATDEAVMNRFKARDAQHNRR